MKKIIVLAILTMATSAFARGDKTVFKVKVNGATAQQAYDAATDMAEAIEAAGPSYSDIAMFPALKRQSNCSLSSSEAQESSFLRRKATLVGTIVDGVDVKTGYTVWTATLMVSCEQ